MEALAEAYRRVEGKFSQSAWDVRAAAVRCQMQLGDIDGGPTAMRALLAEVVAADCDSSELALELRLDLAELLAGTGDVTGALELLEPMHADLCILRGVNDEFTVAVAERIDELRDLYPH